MSEVLTMRVTPCGDWFQTFPIDENNYYDITEQEAIALSEHRLKWSTDDFGKPILIENDNEEDIAQTVNGPEIFELRQYLESTDYVVIKIQEAINNEDEALVAALKSEYANVLAQRRIARSRINELETTY